MRLNAVRESRSAVEPQFMIIGHAAGVAASLAVERGIDVHDVPRGVLQAALRADGQVVDLPSVVTQ